VSAPASEGSARKRGLLTVLVVFAALLALAPMSAFGDSGDGGTDDAAVEEGATDFYTVSAAEAAALRAARPAKAQGPKDRQLVLRVLSNRADLISGADALVEVVIPDDVEASDVRVTVDGRDVTSAFALRADGTFSGLIDGLALGANEVVARTTTNNPRSAKPGGRSSAHLTITNHPASGPVFSGEQLQPWICAQPVATPVAVTIPGTSLSATVTSRVSGLTGAADANCNAPARYTFWYQPATRDAATCTFTNTGATRCFEPYDLSNPPAAADIATFTNDRGDTVKSIVRVERGTMNRGIYELATFYDPTKPNAPWAAQNGWNGKLYWIFGASSGVSRFQTPASTTNVWNNTALRRGFMVATSSLTDHGTNANDTLAAETVMMVKERVAETYGPIRYTMGAGCSGGSIMQLNIAAAYPGLLNGIQPNCTYPDTFTTAIEVMECGLLAARYYATPSGAALTTTQRNAINGHAGQGFCAAWNGAFLPSFNPSNSGNCGAGGSSWPAALTFDKTLRPQGIRCTASDHDAGMFGKTTGADGITRGNSPLDNSGLQYGLTALQAGVINAEEFTKLNEGVGSFNADFEWVPPARAQASPLALKTAYTAGIVSDGKQLAKAAIIDLRGNQGTIEIHMNWRAWEVRDRLDKANGNHDNQVIWAFVGPGGGAAQPGAALGLLSFTTLDQWLANVEADASDRTVEEKIRSNKPLTAIDRCLTTSGATDAQIAANIPLDSAACPVKYQGSPRQAAGGPLSENVFKCQTKPLDFGSSDYAGVTFTADQQARLAAVFPSGVCDWSKPGVSQVPADGWTTFEDGPGGKPLGPAPLSRGGCPGYAEGNGNATPGQCPGGSAG
jgi:hypothetical protein